MAAEAVGLDLKLGKEPAGWADGAEGEGIEGGGGEGSAIFWRSGRGGGASRGAGGESCGDGCCCCLLEEAAAAGGMSFLAGHGRWTGNWMGAVDAVDP